MHMQRITGPLVFSLLLLGAGLALPRQAHAQTTGTAAGVIVDAQGVLQKRVFADPGGQLLRQRAAAAKAALGPQLAAYSRLRKVSLNRLEKAILDHQGAVSDTMRYLAGLLRVRYVFFYPDANDIVLAGPAEGWTTDAAGRVVGLSSGRPVVQLQDLVVLLRAFPPGKPGPRVIGCSIDPTPEGLAAMQQFLRAAGGRATPADTQFIVDGLRNSLGLQTVTVNGVSPKTNVARILVEADYRMKLIGIGLETPPVHLVSFVERANPAQVSKNALFRWYFVPDYQCVRVSDDSLAMELVGDGVKLVGEDELVGAGGGRQASVGKGNRASQAFVLSFTKKYAEQQDYYGKAHWTMPVLGSEASFAVDVQNAPQQVESAVAAVWKGSRLTTPIGGGVHIEAGLALAKHNRLPDENGKVSQLREQTKLHLAEGQWWWD
jgi:hypothetical protein